MMPFASRVSLVSALLASAACGESSTSGSDAGSPCAQPECRDTPRDDAGGSAAPVRDAEIAARHDADTSVAGDATRSEGTENDASAQATEGCGACADYAPAAPIATLQTNELAELSGLTVSWRNRDIFFAHNDRARSTIFALDFAGKLHARYELEQAGVSDPEDLGIGPCPEGTCLYLADIGDNAAVRGEYAILRFAEPAVPESPGDTTVSVPFERFRFTYEDGSHNAEGLLVARSGALYVISKGSGPSSVYRLSPPLSTTGVARATKVATLPVPAATDMAASAAASHPCGLGFLLRTYNRVYEFRATGADFESAFAAAPAVVAMPAEPQSEGISYLADGRGFLSSGEGASAPIVETACR